jgi:hypothetical protein
MGFVKNPVSSSSSSSSTQHYQGQHGRPAVAARSTGIQLQQDRQRQPSFHNNATSCGSAAF